MPPPHLEGVERGLGVSVGVESIEILNPETTVASSTPNASIVIRYSVYDEAVVERPIDLMRVQSLTSEPSTPDHKLPNPELRIPKPKPQTLDSTARQPDP